MIKQFPNIELIVLDDAFQHRYVKPKVSVFAYGLQPPRI